MRSLAVTPARQLAVDGDRHRLGPACGSVWVASTCSTSLVPMPKASAPNAPCVEVCAVAADDRHAGLGQAQLRADDVHDALLDVAQRVQPDAELGAVLAQRLDLRAATPGRRSARAMSSVGDVVVLGRDVRSGRRTGRPASAQAVERLRAGDLVHEVQVDVEQVGLRPSALAHDVRVQTFSARVVATVTSRAVSLDISEFGMLVLLSWDSLAPSASSTKRWPFCVQSTASRRLAELVRPHGPAPRHRAPAGRGAGGARTAAPRGGRALAPGPALAELAHRGADPLLEAASAVLPRLRDTTGESAQLYRRDGTHRVCVAAAERTSGLRDTVPVGSRLPMTAGSGAKVLAAWADPATQRALLPEARFTERTLLEVRRRGWAQSVAEREAGVASVSAPVRDPAGTVVAAVSVSGPVDRIGRRPGVRWAADLLAAADALQHRL